MATPRQDEIDRLFQLPPSEFTAARNALARSAGSAGAAIKALTKPPVAAWAVNQLYWKDRDTYEALVEAAVDLRRAHTAVLEGRAGDLRSAGRAHERALDTALKATLSLMRAEGQPVTDATRQAIVNTLRALPADEAPGRLTRALAPGGFEMLAGVTVAPGAGTSKARRAARPGKSTAGTARGKPAKAGARAAREAEKAREQREALEQAIRAADQRARHAEFEAARAARAAINADERRDAAQRALDEAREALREAKAAAREARRAREQADRRVKETRSALETLQGRL
ncbi:MAG TPA: hypothetical protein VM364_02915 [Vicinamibacterales bacterium]|nr:hypothetical protein [Vicinamibacterales bacterium]